VAADLQETIALVKKTIEAHEGVKLEIQVSLPPIALDSDVEGFESIVVSYFTVPSPPLLNPFVSCVDGRTWLTWTGISNVICMDLGVF
jgi:hypothetical protein